MTRSALCAFTDPRALKRERHSVRDGFISAIRAARGTRRCWWTWPLGHEYRGRWITTSPARSVTRCETCGTPCSFDAFSFYDLIREADDAGVPEAVCESLTERWRTFA